MKKLPNRVHQSVCALWLLDKRYVIRARGFWMPRNLSSENNGSPLPSPRPKSRIAAEGNERLVLKDADGTSKQRGGVHEIVPLLSCGELGRVPIRLRAPIHNPKGAAGRGKSKSRLKSYPHLPSRFTPHDTIVKARRAGLR